MSHNSAKFTEHFTSRFCIRDLKTSGKSVKFDLPNHLKLFLRSIYYLNTKLYKTCWTQLRESVRNRALRNVRLCCTIAA